MMKKRETAKRMLNFDTEDTEDSEESDSEAAGVTVLLVLLLSTVCSA